MIPSLLILLRPSYEKRLNEKLKAMESFYSMKQLLSMCRDMWIAGQETTSNTLSWGLIYLMLDQDLQAKLHEELDSVIGSDRLITMDDKPNLHYTSAVVNEIQRIANLVPMNVRHTIIRDVTINGYYIPKGTSIIPQLSVVLYDDKIFPNHDKFDPSRFLDKNGKWKRVDELIPFSIGKRQCLGEGLARMELFLFAANIFNQFKLKNVPNKPPSLVRKLGATAVPESFVCQVENRY